MPAQSAGIQGPGSLRTRRTVRIVGCLLSLVSPGAGQFLLGGIRRGIAWAVGTAAVVFGLLFVMPVSLVGITGAIAAGILAHVASAVDTLRMPVSRRSWKVVLVAWAALLVGGWVVQEPLKSYYRTHVARSFTISSGSMEPTLLRGDYILTDSALYRSEAPRRGDIVVLKYPRDERREFVERIVGMPGDQIVVRGREVYIDGVLLAEPYVNSVDVPAPAGRACGYAYGCEPITVPANSYFVMGDSRDNSQDSRYWGFVRRDKIVGRVFAIYFSWDGLRHGPRFERVGRGL